MQSVFEYLDYREYLRDYYQGRKRNSKFSYREFSKMAGFSSPVFIKLVIEGQSNLRKSSIPKINKALGLVKKERLYFKYLVLFNQAKSINDKMQFLNELKKASSSINIHFLQDKQFEYFSEWYHSVIRELLNTGSFTGDFEDLANQVQPAITAKEAKQSVELLKTLGLIAEDSKGNLKVTNQLISSKGFDMSTLAVRNFQRKITLMAADAIDNVPKVERDISGVTIGISEKGFKKVSEELERCRTRLLEIAAEDDKSERVFRANLHLYPLSKKNNGVSDSSSNSGGSENE